MKPYQFVVYSILGFILITFVGCSSEDPEQGIVSLIPESWISREFQQWPQLVLTNEAHFNGHSSLFGASAFLIENEKGKVFAATARHLLGVNGGVKPEVDINDLNDVLLSWSLYPRTRETESIRLTSLAIQGLDEPNMDWLILKIHQKTSYMPSHPIIIRKQPVKIGETVFLVGVPYSDKTSSQNLYKGTVTQRTSGDRFKYTIEPPVDIRGFSGAPILDEKGYGVGVMTLWFNPKMEGNRFLEAGGEDFAPIYDLINQNEG